MKTFWVRAVNLVLIAALIIGYNTVLTLRDKDDQIANLTAELESANLYKQAVLQSQDAAASGGAYTNGVWKGTAQGFGGDIPECRWLIPSAELHSAPQVSRMQSHRHWKRRQNK